MECSKRRSHMAAGAGVSAHICPMGMIVQSRNSDSNRGVKRIVGEGERRRVVSRQITTVEKAYKEIATVGVEVDKLAKQVSVIENEIKFGRRVGERCVKNLVELLMNQLIKLDSITAEGDLKLHRRMLVKRVQKYIEALDKSIPVLGLSDAEFRQINY